MERNYAEMSLEERKEATRLLGELYRRYCLSAGIETDVGDGDDFVIGIPGWPHRGLAAAECGLEAEPRDFAGALRDLKEILQLRTRQTEEALVEARGFEDRLQEIAEEYGGQ